jgi:minor extracellular serine protease Vpr
MRKSYLIILLCCFFAGNGNALLLNQQDVNSYIVVLREPSLCNSVFDEQGKSVYKGISTRKDRYVRHLMRHRIELEDKLKRFENRLKGISPDIILRRRFTGLLNGLSLEMPGRIAPAIRSLPEVLTIVPNRKYHLLLTKSNKLMNTPLTLQINGVESYAGKGVKIGIIDTGIDHTHVMFDDEGYEVPAGFPRGDTDFTNNKIIVARVFTKSGDSASDSTPRDRDGHGTHVASCAAGNPNTASPLGLMSGVAPNAYLGNYKVFTSDFTTLEQIISALEASVEDGMDIVNLSLGSESYINELLDPEALAIKNAIKAGVVVVAAAGNSGQSETIGSPGQIPEVITVGSLTNAHNGDNQANQSLAMMNVYADGEPILEEQEVFLAQDPDFFSTPLLGRFGLIDADNLDGESFGSGQDGLVCDSLPAGSAVNKWVLVQRGVCTFTTKIDNVQGAGGLGALVYNQSDANEAPDEPLRSPSVPGTEIPSYFISHNVGLLIKDAIQAANVVEVEFYATAPSEREQIPFELSTFSSLGPSLGYTVKPEIVAIGEGSYAATQNDFPGQFRFNFFEYTSFDLSGFSFSSGTSFSSPRVAGVAALVKQLNPSWEPEDIKSAIVISAERLSTLASLSGMDRGGGHVNSSKAISLPLIATPSTLSWGNILIDDGAELEKTVRLRNVSEQTQFVTLSPELSNNDWIQSVEILPGRINLVPYDSIDVLIKMKFSPPGQLGEIEDTDGDIIIGMKSQREPLRVPVWARVMKVPSAQTSILLIDDDGGHSNENQYIEAVGFAGYGATLWDVGALNAYPSLQYMQNFQAALWFMSTTSLNAPRVNGVLPFNDRIRFNVELTKYLAQGGRLLVSGMDWSDQQEDSIFAQQVLHISEFVHDPFVQYSFTGDILSQETTLDISGIVDSPISLGLPDLSAEFDTDFPNMTDILILDHSDVAKPALVTNHDPNDVIGITVETGSYRAMFFSFALERISSNRISNNGMDIIVKNSLDWLTDGSRNLLSIKSIEPAIQSDNSVPLTVTLVVEGINFLVGHDVFLNDIPVAITSIDLSGILEILVPAGLPQGLYDITLRSPDGQNTTIPKAFTIEYPDQTPIS